jgi:translation initiation factor 3 subunit L
LSWFSFNFFSCSEEGLSAFEELFVFACPKFITANPPPYDDPEALSALLSPSDPPDPPALPEPGQRHLALFLSDVSAQIHVPTLRSFLKMYTSLDVTKLAGFLDVGEEEMISRLMVMKNASRTIVCRNQGSSEKGLGLLDGESITTSDLNFVIDEVRLIAFFWTCTFS